MFNYPNIITRHCLLWSIITYPVFLSGATVCSVSLAAFLRFLPFSILLQSHSAAAAAALGEQNKDT